MMDEQLIDEVAQHGVIYNRQKYYLNGSTNGGKYETKDEAWQLIAMKLRTDVDTCKKRWKYLRERYVSQRKQGDPPVYEHLSRPYLEKMKFLDQHIQPRKSYRHVPNFLTSPHSANSSSYNEYQALDKSNGSNGMKNVSQFGGSGGSGQGHHYHQPDQQQQQQHPMSALSTAAASALETVNGQVKIEADQVFRDFAAAVASQQLQQISQSQMQQQAAAVAAVMADSSQGYQEQYKDSSVGVSGVQNSGGSLTSTSSSMKSPLSSPLQVIGAGSLHSQQQQQQQQHQQQQQPQQSPASGGQQLPVVHSSSSAAGSSISTSSNMQQMQQQQQSHVYNPKGNDDLDSSSTSGNFHMKKPRVQINGHNQMASNGGGSGGHFGNDSDDDSDDNSHDLMEPQVMMHESHYSNSMGMQRGNSNNGVSNNNSGSNNQQQQQQQQQQQHQQQQQQHQNMFPSNTDFLFQLYQQFPHQASGSHPSNFGKFQAPPNQQGVQRLSEHLLGELVTSELLKMNKERKKSAQKRILEILFFDD